MADISRRQWLIRSLTGAAAAGCGLSAIPSRAAENSTPKDVPWLDEVQQPPAKRPDNAPKLSKLLIDQDGKPIDTLNAWRKRREQIRKYWLDFLGPLKIDQKPPALKVIKEDKPKGVIRQLVRYQSEPGIAVEAYLLKPDLSQAEKTKPMPGVVVLHSTVNHTIRQPAGVEGKPEKAFGLHLARLGFVTFCPKNFLWVGQGHYNQRVDEFKKRHPGSKGMAKMLYDAQRAVDVLLNDPDVDKQRIGAVGHSLGAKEVLYLAALDSRVKVTVSSEGGIGTKFSNWDAPWYLGKTINEKDFGHEHHELLALAAPQPFLLVGGDSADGARSWPFIAEALKVYRLHKPDQRPRLGLLNHHKGHSVPPIAQRRISQWLSTYLLS